MALHGIRKEFARIVGVIDGCFLAWLACCCFEIPLVLAYTDASNF